LGLRLDRRCTGPTITIDDRRKRPIILLLVLTLRLWDCTLLM
jgi:hypothetical protein